MVSKDINQLIDSIKTSQKELNKLIGEKGKGIENLVGAVMNILRFIDSKILTSSFYRQMPREFKHFTTYYKFKGILVYSDIHTGMEIKREENPAFGTFNDEDEFIETEIITQSGECIYLVRSGDFVRFTVDGTEIDPRYGDLDPANYFYSLKNPKELSEYEVVIDYPEFEENFIKNFKQAVIEAIKQNPNKKSILKKIIDYFNALDAETGEEKV